MDLVDYEQQVFDSIRADFEQFAGQLDLPHVRFIPLSALKGDNVAKSSQRMSWYEGPPLLQMLETIDVSLAQQNEAFRFPVQWISRPNSNFRGFSGTVASGVVRVGDAVTVLPSGKKSHVKRIVFAHGAEDAAGFGRATTLVLEDEIDISRGDMLVAPDDPPTIHDVADAMLIWMSEKPLTPGRSYWLKHTTKKLSAEVEALHYETDVNTLQRRQASTLKLNQIGLCRIRTSERLCFDDYQHNRQTGSFILVDKVSCETVAAGMLTEQHTDSQRPDYWNAPPATVKIESYKSLVSAEQRADAYSQTPFTLLITGFCGAGKTTLAQHLEKELFSLGKVCLVLDGGDLRGGINRDLGFTTDDRSENLRRAAEIAHLANRNGQICLAAFVAPHRSVRQRVRELIGGDRFFHVHLPTPIDECRQRDHSGQYDLAERGEIDLFPGVSATYDEPTDADLILDTSTATPPQLAMLVLDELRNKSLL
jgi:bifunctional enzyme CysN/CysC